MFIFDKLNDFVLRHNYNRFILFLLIFVTFFVTLNCLPPLDRDESRYMQSTLQMIETGDFLNISFLDTTRNKKPPGIYWIQAASALAIKNIFSLEEFPVWSFRLPSAIGASLSIWLTFLIGKALYGRKVGYLASVMLISTPLIFVESHIAKTDSILLALVLLPLLVVAKIIEGLESKSNGPSNILVYSGWFALGASLIIKGPIALIILFLTIFFINITNKDFQLKTLKPLLGIIFLILASLPCLLWIYYTGTSDFVKESLVNDMFLKIISSQESHGAPPGFFIITSFLSCWPLSLFFIPTAIWAYQNRRDNKIKYLLCWLIPTLVIFEFIPTKLLHYVLPLLPSLSILSAAMIFDYIEKRNFSLLDKNIYKIIIFIPTLVSIFFAFSILFIGLKYAESSLFIEITISIIYFIAFLFSVYFMYTNRLLLLANVAGIINVLCLSAFTAFVTPKLEKIWISENIHGYVKNNNIDKPVILLGYSEPSAVFRLGSDTLIANNVEESLFHLKNGKKNLLIVEKKFEDILIEKIKFMGIKIHKHDYQIEGINYSKGKKVLLSIYSN